MEKLRIGYLGLGLMGGPMALNIMKAGYPMTVWNRTAVKADEHVAQGARLANSPAEAAKDSDIVFINVSDTPDVLALVFGQGGIAEGADPGLVIVDNSTIKPSASRQIYARMKALGVSSLDAPVSGGTIGAQNGTLTIMVGGDADALEKAMPVMLCLGKKITHIGEAGTGQIAKAANQIMVAAQMVAEAELLVFAQKAGADPQKVIEAIKGGAAQCWTLDNKPQRLFAGNRTPGFKCSLQAKDMNIVMETAREFLVSVPATAVNTQLFNGMVANGEGDLDNSAVISLIEKLSNETLRAN
ncbi:MAG: NAD(P)-dependent oxidoreductase [Anaerolineaceae bacterium]|nr:NAD(P)-dependent oxidoreductase [Anaerolineaceae bacterium]